MWIDVDWREKFPKVNLSRFSEALFNSLTSQVLQRKIEEAKGYNSTTQVVISISIAATDTFKYDIRIQQYIGSMHA